jgi:hypothetical protein
MAGAQYKALNSNTGGSIFSGDSILELTLSGNLRELLDDRAEISSLHKLMLKYKNPEGHETGIPIEAKTRGHFRKMTENCSYPPLQLQFTPNSQLDTSFFSEQHKMKLVMPCQGEAYIVREWLAYKIYNLVTPLSFQAKLVKVTMDDTKKKKNIPPFYGILLEEEKQLAKRNKLVSIDRKINPQQTNRNYFLTMVVFQYLIGNTDWSIQYQQNIKLMATDSNATPISIPYDFDHSGLVGAPYAHPAEELQMQSVQERRFRGYCMENLKEFEPILAKYNALKPAVLSLINDCVYLDSKAKKNLAVFLEGFYANINTPKLWQHDFAYPCDKNGTGNVVIKGLREN